MVPDTLRQGVPEMPDTPPSRNDYAFYFTDKYHSEN